MGSILNPLSGKFSEDTRKKKDKGAKTGASHDWRSFHLSQNDWLKGSHMTKVVWLPNETHYSYYEFVAPNTTYSDYSRHCLLVHTLSQIHTLLSYGYWLQDTWRTKMSILSKKMTIVAYLITGLHFAAM